MSNILHLKTNKHQPIQSTTKKELDEAFDIILGKRAINESLANEKSVVSLKKKEVDAFLPILIVALYYYEGMMQEVLISDTPKEVEFWSDGVKYIKQIRDIFMKSERYLDLISIHLDYYEFEQFISVIALRISVESNDGTADPVLQAIYDKWSPVFLKRWEVVEA
ncbi:MAG TPA: hypothetical protein VFC84_13150 [Desulfosporosinus sp.]|nr:hypothetical protein [Desulfosporosinus sp.]